MGSEEFWKAVDFRPATPKEAQSIESAREYGDCSVFVHIFDNTYFLNKENLKRKSIEKKIDTLKIINMITIKKEIKNIRFILR